MSFSASYPSVPQDSSRENRAPRQESAGQNAPFDLLEWHPVYKSCQKFFLDHAQYDTSVQAVASLINISLPHQWLPTPIVSYLPEESSDSAEASNPGGNDTQMGLESPSSTFATARPRNIPPPPPYLTISASRHRWVSLVPFVRRLVVTGFDREPVLHGFFGDDWRKGVGPIQECERRNYLFAAKSGGWATVKSQYDMSPQETVPFLQPPQNMQLDEIENAEKLWSQWLAMEDWMPHSCPRSDHEPLKQWRTLLDWNKRQVGQLAPLASPDAFQVPPASSEPRLCRGGSSKTSNQAFASKGFRLPCDIISR